MAIPGCSRNYVSEAAIPKNRIVIFGTADGAVNLASAATQLFAGVSELGCTAAGDRLDVIKSGNPKVEYGGTVTRGQMLTADSVGRAIAAAPATGANVQIIGSAEISGVVGDIGELNISRSVMQG